MMMRSLIVVATGLALASCAAKTPEPEQQCEDFIKRKITTPTTFKRVNVGDHGTVMKDGREFWVRIDYDAQNEYGALTRSSFICQFPAKQGSPDLGNYIDFDAPYEAAADKLENDADNITAIGQ